MSEMVLRGDRWEPSIPLPFYGLLHVRCRCGERFWGWHIQIRCKAREHYEQHFRQRHIHKASGEVTVP